MTDKTAEQTAIRLALLANGYTPRANGTTAPEATKRGYGLWRGEVVHPADPRMNEIVASGDPITDTKGLGLRYVSVRGPKVVPHFRVHDPEKFSAALDHVFPAVHDSVVRLVAEDIRAGGYDALARWCVGVVLPERFEIADVVCEMRCCEHGVVYRPDISVLHSEGGRIELEVVNTHAPEGSRLDAAWGAGHLVLSLRIRDLVEQIVFSEGRGAVPDDEMFREMLRGRRFSLCGHERVPEAVQVVWRDLNLSAYAMELRATLRAAYWTDYRYVVDPFTTCAYGLQRSEIDESLDTYVPYYNLLYDSPSPEHENTWAAWYMRLRKQTSIVSAPGSALYEAAQSSEDLLDVFMDSTKEPNGVRRLRHTLCAVWHVRTRWMQRGAEWLWDRVRDSGPHDLPEFKATERGVECPMLPAKT